MRISPLLAGTIVALGNDTLRRSALKAPARQLQKGYDKLTKIQLDPSLLHEEQGIQFAFLHIDSNLAGSAFRDAYRAAKQIKKAIAAYRRMEALGASVETMRRIQVKLSGGQIY